MVDEISVEDLRPYLEKRKWHDRNRPVKATESSDERFFEAMRESAENINGSRLMDAFRVGASC